MTSLFSEESLRRTDPSRFALIEEFKLELQLTLESQSLGRRPSVPEIGKDRGAFFKVVIPQGYGPIHLVRLIITGLVEGSLTEDKWILVLYDLIERVFNQALRDRKFRIKWRNVLKALSLIATDSLPKIRKSGFHRAKVTYLLINRIGQFTKVSDILIPPKNRVDQPLQEIKVLRHQRYEPPQKKSTKVPSNSAGTKGTYAPDSISWKEVASQERVFINGKWSKSVFETHPNDIGEVT
jgi:hypothetical protein